ncbi:MAG: PBP1A family penicillin-binding protein [Ignavibacteriaceae bacterium]|nr:PBP1A family penicillin-binding protein [Ignavibacteriaceae bacterium]
MQKSSKNITQNHYISIIKKFKYLFIGFAVVVLAFIIYVFLGLPSIEELENPRPQLASKVWTVDGEILGQFYIENRIETNVDSIPSHLINALIATEDRNFYSHWGVDLIRFGKAMIKNIFTFSREGASTITQQLAKNLYSLKSINENPVETVARKIREWLSSVQIERNFTKKEIIELYLNVSYFGKSAYGVETAANIYFGKRAKELTVPESALLIALLKSSVNYDPERRMERALARRNLVMRNMMDAGYLSESNYEKFRIEPIILAKGKKVKMRSEAPHFLEYIRQQMIAMADKYGYDLFRDGLNIYTSINMSMQKIANKVVVEHLREYQELFYKNWKWDNNKAILKPLIDRAIKNTVAYKEAVSQVQKQMVYSQLINDAAFIDSVKLIESTIQTGFVVLDPKSGAIKALVGGTDQDFQYGLNHVTQIRRQPGSSFKPIIYTTAIDNGYYPAYSLLNEKFNFNGWSPDNSDSDYGGYLTLRRALANSINVIAGRLTISEIAPPNMVVKYAHKMGINSSLSAFPSIALGTVEVTPLELTSAFSTLANKGVFVSPISILRIEDKNGIIIDEFKPEYREAISPQTAAIVTSMMEDVLNYGTGARVRQYFSRPAAGKTGTTQDFADAWFVGFTPQLAGGVWTGFDDRRVKFNGWYGQGARASMPVWAKFMAEVYKQLNLPLEYFTLPDGVEYALFCKETIERGDTRLANESCPNKISDLINVLHKPQNCNLHGGSAVSQQEKESGSGW